MRNKDWHKNLNKNQRFFRLAITVLTFVILSLIFSFPISDSAGWLYLVPHLMLKFILSLLFFGLSKKVYFKYNLFNTDDFMKESQEVNDLKEMWVAEVDQKKKKKDRQGKSERRQ